MNQLEMIKKELKRIASVKCRLNKQKGRSTYNEDIQKVLDEENKLKALRDSLVQPKKTVTTFTYDDIKQLSYEDTLKAIKSIQSKKSNTKWLTHIEGDNDEYRNACKIEEMLVEHKSQLQPTTVTIKAKITEVLDNSDDLSKDELIELLRSTID